MEDKDVIKQAVAEVLAEHLRTTSCGAACRLDDDDIVFFKRLKKVLDNAAAGIGMAVILGLLSGIIWLVVAGAEVWRTGGGK